MPQSFAKSLIRVLFQRDNFFSGNIPSELGLLSKLQIWVATDNLLSGPVPENLWSFPSLLGLDIDKNAGLSGTIPTNIQLSWGFNIAETSMGGTIPSEVGLLSNFLYITVEHTQVTGTIPTEITNLGKLTYLLVNDNSLTGTFPAMNSTSLRELRMENTSLTGLVPDAVCGIPDLSFDCPDMCGCDCPCDA